MIDPRGFRDVIDRFATGVTVMTTAARDTLHGMTASAVASLSLDPVLVLVCVDHAAPMHDLVLASRVFALSFLDAESEAVAVHFAEPYDPGVAQQFAAIAVRPEVTGSPVLEIALGYVDCEVVETHDSGDHLIVVGRVVVLGAGTRDDPLLFYRGGYRRLQPPDS